MELRDIETFLALAEELHFGRTAERLHVSPSRVSQTVSALERQVGTRLFDRTSRRVGLTPAGARLRDGLRPALEQIRATVADVRESASGITGELHVSLLDFAAGGPRLTAIVRAFETAHPGCRVTVFEAFPGAALNRLRRGELQAVAHWLPLEQPDLTVGPVLAREERALAVPDGHPLAVRGHATLDDLAGCAIVDAEAALPPETLHVLAPRQTPDGRPIPRRHRAGRMVETLSLVARGEVVHPTVASLGTYYAHPGVTLVPLEGVAPLESALVWATDRTTSAVLALAEQARRGGDG